MMSSTVSFPGLSWVDKEFEVSTFNFVAKADPSRPTDAPTLQSSLTINETDASIYDWSTSEELGISVTASPTMSDAFQVAPPIEPDA